jgi:hypothetical protein
MDIQKFWKEFPIPTQEEREDFPFANPSDASRALIRSRNWAGTITEALIEKSQQLKHLKNLIASLDLKVDRLERHILIANPPASWATKNKEMQRTWVWSKATEADLMLLTEMEESKDKLKNESFSIEKDLELYNQMLKTLEKTTEWVIQYLNWIKHENNLD